MVGTSAPMQRVHELVEKASRSSATVLIRGESGTGKEVAARSIHEGSSRRDGPFVKLQCSALPDTLLESELFGYEKGAFTGATARKDGRLELANGGTLFLDEIGDITPATQVKLLGVLQDRAFERLGGTERIHIDVRVIAATHRDLDAMVKHGEFRADLFYRLSVVPLWLPPLRTRREDIAALAKHFCSTFGAANSREAVELSEEALAQLRRQRWPGNVRELENFVERLVVLAEQDVIDASAVLRELSSGTPAFVTQATQTTDVREIPASAEGLLDRERREAEKRALVSALERSRGNRTEAARALGVSRRTLYNLLEDHGVT
ncbi:MAG TPA: sigma-54 dependent transcriptional regulator [Polyangiaceae bacterium]|nr:sigma-54 dependent transcriptional regulator [Polyangiaceae bacterium]